MNANETDWDEHDFDHLYLGPPTSDITPTIVGLLSTVAVLAMSAIAGVGVILAWCI